jgi:glycerophosphoryl diester phosphodiesterase
MKTFKKIIIYMTLPLFIFLVITVLIPYINFIIQNKELKTNINYKIESVAHRGASKYAPENTLASFKKALEENADIIELDVHVSKDDSLIIMHDSNTKRTTGTEGEIENLNFRDIRKLNAGFLFEENYKNEKIPTLDEVLKLVNGRSTVLIELKWPKNGIYINLVKEVLKCIAENNAQKWVIIQSFETAYLKEILSTTKTIDCHQLVFGWSNILPLYYDRKICIGNFEPLFGVKSVNIFYLYLSKSFVSKMHSKNIKVFVFTLDDKEKIIQAINLGADGIISNDHRILKKLLNH